VSRPLYVRTGNETRWTSLNLVRNDGARRILLRPRLTVMRHSPRRTLRMHGIISDLVMAVCRWWRRWRSATGAARGQGRILRAAARFAAPASVKSSLLGALQRCGGLLGRALVAPFLRTPRAPAPVTGLA